MGLTEGVGVHGEKACRCLVALVVVGKAARGISTGTRRQEPYAWRILWRSLSILSH